MCFHMIIISLIFKHYCGRRMMLISISAHSSHMYFTNEMLCGVLAFELTVSAFRVLASHNLNVVSKDCQSLTGLTRSRIQKHWLLRYTIDFVNVKILNIGKMSNYLLSINTWHQSKNTGFQKPYLFLLNVQFNFFCTAFFLFF